MKVKELIANLSKLDQDMEVAPHILYPLDVKGVASDIKIDLTDAEVDSILETLGDPRHQDFEQGLTWDVVSAQIYGLKE